jgi:hypothetical protein
MKRPPRLLIVIAATLFVIGGSLLAIKFAKGYRPSLKSKTLKGTGLLVATSYPKGASVFINNKLTTATDDTLNLPPGEYQIKIAKDGYISWEKTLILEAELVTQTNARLFPAVPDLKPLTFSGALNPTPSPNGQKILFAVANATSDSQNGLYVLDLPSGPLSFKSEPRQIARSNQHYDFSQAQFSWSPNSTQVLASFNSGKTNEANILLNVNSFNDTADFKDVTARLPVILAEWNELLEKKDHERLAQLPQFIQQLATQSATALYWSPDEDKLMYTATASAQIPENLIPPLPASSTQTETRQLEPNNIYIYDIEEDKNFKLGSVDQPILWYPDSRHVIIVENNKIIIAEYDGTNRHTVYAGPFAADFAYPWPNGSRLIILASLNGGGDLPPNLYSINLK